jgi:pyruvate/2-oxoglutarate dehydrogenase complex dihydrolipoamide acyltransferase (E2) component
MSRPRNPALLTLLCAAGASIALAACGGSASNPTAGQAKDAKLVKFAKCMREHGVNVSTPTGSTGLVKVTGNAGSPHALEAAQHACKAYEPSAQNANVSPQERVAREEAVQKFARCMRKHGIDVHAETSGGGARIGIQVHAGANAGGPNPESPAFQSAQKACQGLLPFKGGGPGGGPGATTGEGGGPANGFSIGG